MIGNIRGIFGTGLTDAEYETARILMGMLIINLAMTFPNSVFNCSITAHEKFLFQKLLILLQNIFSPFLTLDNGIWLNRNGISYDIPNICVATV